MQNDTELDFSTILATSAHDMKNSLFMLLQSMEQLNFSDNLTTQQHQSIADLHYQTSRLNGSLMQLLSLYREEHNQLPFYIEENSVPEMLQEVVDRNQLFLNSHHVKVDIEVDEDLTAFFDQDLVTYLIADIFINALRHTNSKVTLRAYADSEYVNIQVEDDGQGYPEHMLAINVHNKSEFNAFKGRSGLGLLFAHKIAAAHKTNDLQGHILLENKQNPSGSLFTLKLP